MSMHIENSKVYNLITDLITSFISIQPKQRTKFTSLFIFLHYACDYIIMWELIQTTVKDYSPIITLTLPYLLSRMITAILFIVFQHPLFYLLNKIAILVQLSTTVFQPPQLQFINFFLQILMSIIWALTKQQRMTHFDSKLGQILGFLKQSTIYGSLFLQSIFYSNNMNLDSIFIMLISSLSLYFIDGAQFYYKKMTKHIFMNYDIGLSILALIVVLKPIINFTFVEFLIVSVVVIISVGVNILLTHFNLKKDIVDNTCKLQDYTQLQLAQFLVRIRQQFDFKKSKAIDTFLYKIKQQETGNLVQKLSENQTKTQKRQSIQNMIFQMLKKQSRTSSFLKDLIIFLYSPSPKLYTFLDMKNWIHKRQYQRMVREQITDTSIQQSQTNQQIMSIKQRLLSYTDSNDYFFRQLMRQRISRQKVIELGLRMVDILDLFRFQQNIRRCHQVVDLMYKFCSQCLPQRYIPELIGKNEVNGNNQIQYGQIVFSGQQINIGIILSVNSIFVKHLMYQKSYFLKIKITQIIPVQLIPAFSQFISPSQNKKSFKEIPSPFIKLAWLQSALGFIVPSTLQIKSSNQSTGHVWMLKIKPQYSYQIVIVVNKNGKIIGFTQLARYMGFTQSVKGRYIQQSLLDKLSTGENVNVLQGTQFLKDKGIIIKQKITLCILTTLKPPLTIQQCMIIQVKKNPSKLHYLPIQPSENQNFMLNYGWDKRVTTKQARKPQILQQLSVCDQTRERNYAQNITQMRYFAGKIDYKSNFEEQRDCQSLIKHMQQKLTSLSPEQYYQKWQRKRLLFPFWLKIIITCIICLTIMKITINVYIYLQLTIYSSSNLNNLQISNKLFQKLSSTIKLGSLPSLTLFSSSISNIPGQIQTQVTVTNSLSNDIFSLNQNIYTLYNGQKVLDGLNSLNLIINQYLITPSTAQRQYFTILTQNIVSTFLIFIESVVSGMINTSTAFQNIKLIINIMFILVSILIIIIIWFIEVKIQKRKSQIVQILKFIDNDYLSLQCDKVTRFRQIWLENGQVEDIDQSDQNSQKTNPPKHIVKKIVVEWNKFYIIAWVISSFLIILNSGDIIASQNHITSNYLKFNNYVNEEIIYLQASWTEFNNLSPSNSLYTNFTNQAINKQYQSLKIMQKMMTTYQLTSDYASFYDAFWQSSKVCQYLSLTSCPSIISGGTSEGANIITGFLNRQYDLYINLIAKNSSIYNDYRTPDTSILALYYLPKMMNIGNNNLLTQFKSFKSGCQLFGLLMFALGLIVSLAILLVIPYYTALRKKVDKLQQLLMMVPFQKLREIPTFHKFYTVYYASY